MGNPTTDSIVLVGVRGMASGCVPNRRGGEARIPRCDTEQSITRGDGLMTLHFASTTALLIEDGGWRLRPDLRPGDRERVGQALN